MYIAKRIHISGLFFYLLIIFSNAYAATNLTFQINGVQGEALANINHALNALKAPYTDDLNTVRVQQIYRNGDEVVNQALQAYGFFKAGIRSELVQQNDSWKIIYHIVPGSVLLINRLDLTISGEAATDSAFQSLLNASPLKEGTPLWSEHYHEIVQSLLNLARERGYFNAEMPVHQITIDLENYYANITIRLNSGKRYHFGKLTFTHTKLRDAFVKKFIPFTEGDDYTNQQILQLQQNLFNTNYFQRVSVQPQIQQTDDYNVPVNTDLELNKPQNILIGLGYGTDTGARTSLGWDWRYINSRGHKLNNLLTISQIRRQIESRYIIPANNPLTDYYSLTASYDLFFPDKGFSKTTLLGAGYSTTRSAWQQIYQLDFINEKFQTINNAPIQISRIIMPSFTLQRAIADDPLYVKRGYKIGLNVRGAAEQLGSSVTFSQLSTNGKLIHPLTDSTRFITRIEAGATKANDINVLPRSLRFYSGGSRSLRGYDYEELGPGKYLTEFSVELQQRIFGDNWYLAGFYDMGNAFDQLAPGNNLFNRLYQTQERSIGTGIVWLSPVGAIALTVAQSVSDKSRGWKIQFSMGPEL